MPAGKGERQNVAFLDLTFSVQKSETMLRTVFEAQEVRARAARLDDEAAEWRLHHAEFPRAPTTS